MEANENTPIKELRGVSSKHTHCDTLSSTLQCPSREHVSELEHHPCQHLDLLTAILQTPHLTN